MLRRLCHSILSFLRLPVRLLEGTDFIEGWEETPNEIRHRLQDPGMFDTCRSKDVTAGVSMIICKKKGTDQWMPQALRFDKSKFDLTQAKAWVAKNGAGFKESFTVAELDKLTECEPLTLETRVIEADGEVTARKGDTWEVTVLNYGKSKRPPHFHYGRENMLKSLPVFHGARVYANREADDFGHKGRNKKVTSDIVGVLSDPFDGGTGVKASLNILPSAAWLKENLLFLEKRGKLDVFQLSIDGSGIAKPRMIAGEQLPDVETIHDVDVDIVARGAAGGSINKLIESLSTTHNNIREGAGLMKPILLKLMTLFQMLYPKQFVEANFDWAKVNENELFTKLMECDKTQDRFLKLPDGAQLTEALVDEKLTSLRTSLNAAGGTGDGAGSGGKGKKGKKADDGSAGNQNQDDDATALTESMKQIKEQMELLQKTNCQNLLEAKLAGLSNLPKPLIESIRKTYTDKDGHIKLFTEAELSDTIKNVRDTYAQLFPGIPQGVSAQPGMAEEDKLQLAMDGFFLEANRAHPLSPDERKTMLKGVVPFRSIRESYILTTGDVELSGQKQKSRRFAESIATTDFPKVVADAANKALVREYPLLNLDTYRTFVDVTPLKDFKTQHRIRYGGYGNLPIVAQRAAYLPVTSPTDEEATYVPAKRGGTEDLTWEMILNDDVGAVRRIPQRLARAAAQTLHEFVYDLIKPSVNPTIYDSIALYEAGTHKNTATAALDSAGLTAARLRMKKQPNKDSAKRLGLRARFLLVPSDLEATAYGLLTPAFNKSNIVPEFIQQIGVSPIVVDYWTDATDWVLVADPGDILGIEIGFVNGQETPELFVSDLPNTGSWFTNDVITYKIKHAYGGNIIDFRAFDGSIVAG